MVDVSLKNALHLYYHREPAAVGSAEHWSLILLQLFHALKGKFFAIDDIYDGVGDEVEGPIIFGGDAWWYQNTPTIKHYKRFYEERLVECSAAYWQKRQGYE
jgi:hypothetical protein